MEKEYREPAQHLYKVPFFILSLIIIGIFGYMLIEGWSFLDSFYMVIVTLATIGHGTVKLSWGGQIFTICLAIFSVSIIAYTFRWFSEYIIEGGLRGSLRRIKMEKKIQNLKDHFIICGCGRVGRQIAEEFDAEGIPFVITDQNPDKLKLAENEGWLFVGSKGTEEEILREAGIDKARGLLSVVDEDADNIFITLTARALNPDIYIVSRANFEETVQKLYRAGADKVSMPHKIGGFHMAAMAMRPAVVDFLDAIVSSKEKDLTIEDFEVPQNLSGKSLDQFLKFKDGITVLSINKKSGGSIISPIPDDKVHTGDHLIVMGKKEEIEKVTQALKKED